MDIDVVGRRCLLALFVLLCTRVCMAQTQSPPPWSMGTPIITYGNYSPFTTCSGGDTNLEAAYGWPHNYDPTILTDAAAQQAANGGFNLVWISDPTQLQHAERHGLRAQLILSGPCLHQNAIFLTNGTGCTNGNWQSSCWPYTGVDPYTGTGSVLDYLNTLIDGFKASPAAYSYFLSDEPCASGDDPCASRLPLLGAIARYINQRDPAHLVYVNLLPPDFLPYRTSATRYASFDAFMSDFVAYVGPALLSYDRYALMFDANGNPTDDIAFMTSTQSMAQASAQYGIPFMAIVQGMSLGANSRVPTSGQLAFLANTTLAFGGKGISYFNYWVNARSQPLPGWACAGGPSCGGIAPFPNGTSTGVYTSLRAFNPVYRRTAGKLQALKWTSTYIKGYQSPPLHLTALNANAVFDIPDLHNTEVYQNGAALTGALIGYFSVHGATKFAFVVNLDYSAAHQYQVTGPGPMSQFDSSTGDWTPSGTNSVSVSLPPGGGVLVGLTSAANSASWLPAIIDRALH